MILLTVTAMELTVKYSP